MAEDPIGPAVEARYKELGLTQETLAWLAGVSTTTVRNVLHGRVGEARTWPRIERTLGWKPRSLLAVRDGEEPTAYLATEPLKSLYAALLRMAERESPDLKNALKLWENLQRSVELAGDDALGSDAFAKGDIERLWPKLQNELSPAEAEPLAEAFRDYGWRGEVVEDPWVAESPWKAPDSSPQTPAATTAPTCDCPPVADQEYRAKLLSALEVLTKDQEGMDIFRRLPIRVQQALLDGEVVDSDVIEVPDADDMSIVTMVVRRGHGDTPMSARSRASLVHTLRVWHLTLLTMATTYESFKGEPWRHFENVEKQIQDTLKSITSEDRPADGD